jgi:hypothetical protein
LRQEIARRSANDRQDDSQDNGADQAGQKDGPAGRRVQDDLAAPLFLAGCGFCSMGPLLRDQKSGSVIVPESRNALPSPAFYWY